MLWFITLPTVTMAIWLEGADVNWSRLTALVAFLICTDAGLSTWNDIADVQTDAASSESDRSGRPLVTGALSARWARLQVLLLESTAAVLALVLQPILILLLVPPIAYAWGYSQPRELRASSDRLGRFMAIFMWPYLYQAFWLMLWPMLFVVTSLGLDDFPPTGLGWMYILGNLLFMGVAEILAKDLRDFENDSLAEKRTTVVAIGVGRATSFCLYGFASGALAWTAASVLVEDGNVSLTASLLVVLALWIGRAILLGNTLRREYSKCAARNLHVGAIRVFLTVNLLFIVGLTS